MIRDSVADGVAATLVGYVSRDDSTEQVLAALCIAAFFRKLARIFVMIPFLTEKIS